VTPRPAPEAEVITKRSPRSVADTVAAFVEILTEKRITVFAIIDQAAEARKVGLELRETTLVVFGNPTAGTPVMAASPLAALDLPLKVLVWADGAGSKVSYLSPEAIESRYGLDKSLTDNLAGIHALTDAITE
jgi:uncharacterized protein (DUF302 family)